MGGTLQKKTSIQAQQVSIFINSELSLYCYNSVVMLRQMQLFAPDSLLLGEEVVKEQVSKLCDWYNLDSNAVTRQLNEFQPIYKRVEKLVSVDDLMENKKDRSKASATRCDSDESDESDEDGGIHQEETEKKKKWAEYGFIKPLRVIMELSGFPAITRLYRILASLAITSSSAERVMSRIKIIKDRLTSSMGDPWFSSLTILAAQHDLLEELATDDIIDSFA
jgi:hypothetical protein